MSSLNNNFINKTFNSLLKLFNNESFTGTTTHTISDGLGNTLPVSFSPNSSEFTGTVCADTIVGGTNNNSSGTDSGILGGANNQTSSNCSIIGGGNLNTTLREYSGILGGSCNIANETYSIIGGGCNNTTEGAYSGILGGQNNYTNVDNTFIIGSNITATTENTLYVENISIKGDILDSANNSGVNGQILSKNENGVSWFTVSISTITGDSVSTNTFYTYTSNTNTLIGTKLNISDFNSYSSNTNTLIGTKVDNNNFFNYTAQTLSLINNIVVTSSTIYNSSLNPTLQMPSPVGGISSGTTVSQLTGLTFSRLFDDLLFPTTFPTYTIPTITIGGVSNTTSEVGSTITPTMTVNAVKNDAGVYTLLRFIRNGSLINSSSPTASWSSPVPNQFGLTNPNTPNSGFTITPYSESYVIPAPSGGGTSSSTIYKADGNYNIGLAKPTNKNVTDNRTFAVRTTSAPQLSSNNFESSSFTYTGIYPYFYGTSVTLPTAQSIASAISGGTATKVLSDASGTLSIPYNNSGTFIWVAYFSGYTTKTKWYVSGLDNGNNDGSFITTVVNQNVKSPNLFWDGVNYKIHWSVNATTQSTFEYRNN